MLGLAHPYLPERTGCWPKALTGRRLGIARDLYNNKENSVGEEMDVA
jgi:hypothetical protein